MAGNELELAAGTPEPLTDEQRAAFLAYVDEHQSCSVREACEHVGIKRKQVKALRRMEPEFDADYQEARGRGADEILAEIRRRAIDGWDEPVFQGGEQVGVIRKYSDRLLLALGKGFVAELRDVTRHEHTGPDGGPLEVENPDVAAAFDRFTAQVQRLADRVTEPSGAVRQAEPDRPAEAPREIRG